MPAAPVAQRRSNTGGAIGGARGEVPELGASGPTEGGGGGVYVRGIGRIPPYRKLTALVYTTGARYRYGGGGYTSRYCHA